MSTNKRGTIRIDDHAGQNVQTPTLLVIDPDESFAEQWSHDLPRFGYWVTSVHRLDVARSRVLTGGFDGIVIDVAIGGQQGPELIASIRDDGVGLPMISSSATDDDQIVVRALDAGADDHVIWPTSSAVLDARLRAVTRRSEAPQCDVLRIDDMVLEPKQLRVTHHGSRIDLTPAQAAVLETLMQRAGRVVPRRELEMELPDSWSSRRSNVIDVHIRALRRKIDEPFGCRSIETVRGRGYRFERHACQLPDHLASDADAL